MPYSVFRVVSTLELFLKPVRFSNVFVFLFQLQKKLDTYHRRLREVETNGVVARGRGLRDFGGNLRDFSGGVVGNIKGGLSGLHQVSWKFMILYHLNLYF